MLGGSKEKKALLKAKEATAEDSLQISRSVTSGSSRRVETERGTAVRLPIEYGSISEAFCTNSGANFEVSRGRGHSDAAASINAAASGRVLSQAPSENELARASAAMSRYKYYSKIAPGASSRFIMPSHVVPPGFLFVLPFNPDQNQSSIITIFSIWNTMMGTSLLSMPWAIKEAGFAMSLVVLIAMTTLTFYTAYRVLESYTTLMRKGVRVSEFSDVCRFYFGRPGEVVAVFFSAMALLGAVIVYWVLLSNFLYQTGRFVYNKAYDQPAVDGSPTRYDIGNRSYYVLCPHMSPDLGFNWSVAADAAADEFADSGGANATAALFPTLWDKTDTVPFYLLLLLFPLVSIKSPGFFSKFNALGTVSVAYVLLFVCFKASAWGLHLNFWSTEPMERIDQLSASFPQLGGILSMALFCHSIVVTLMKRQANPSNNPRDLLIAFVCVSLTYLVVGGIFYATFPLAKSCIEQNFLDNIPSSDVLAFTARIFLFIQMITVFPLLMYILRAQLMYYFFKSVYPSWLHVFFTHLVVISMAVLVAHFYPNIGNILRFSGAICGLAYIFTLPSLVYLISEKHARRLTPLKLLAHVVIIALGGVNFVAQFLF